MSQTDAGVEHLITSISIFLSLLLNSRSSLCFTHVHFMFFSFLLLFRKKNTTWNCGTILPRGRRNKPQHYGNWTLDLPLLSFVSNSVFIYSVAWHVLLNYVYKTRSNTGQPVCSTPPITNICIPFGLHQIVMEICTLGIRLSNGKKFSQSALATQKVPVGHHK